MFYRLITDVSASSAKKEPDSEIGFATDKTPCSGEHVKPQYSACRPVGSDQLSINNPSGNFDQVDVNEGKSIGPWSSSKLGRREPPVGEEREDPSPLPIQPKPHGAGKITTPNAVAVATNRWQATGKSPGHPMPSYHKKPAGKLPETQ